MSTLLFTLFKTCFTWFCC